MLAGRAREQALPVADEVVAAEIAPVGATRHQVLRADRLQALGAGDVRIARGHEPDRLAAAGPAEHGRRPDQVAQVRRPLDREARETLEGHPVVLAVDHCLEHRTETHVGIPDPVERGALARRSGPLVASVSAAVVIAVAGPGIARALVRGAEHRARMRPGALEGVVRKRRGRRPVARRRERQRLHQGGEPGGWLAEHHRRAPPFKDRFAQQLAAQQLAVGLRHQPRLGIELGGDVELVARSPPLARHHEELEEEDARGRIGRPRAHARHERVERPQRVARGEALFGGVAHRPGPGLTPRCSRRCRT